MMSTTNFRQISKTESVILVQQAFQRRFGIATPSTKKRSSLVQTIRRKVCWCKRKSSERPRTSEEAALKVQDIFRKAHELGIPQPTVWRVLRRHLTIQPYKLHMMQAHRAGDSAKLVGFSSTIARDMEDDNFLTRLIFSDQATYLISGKGKRLNVRIWGLKNPQEILQHQRDSPKVNVLCTVSLRKVYEPFFFEENAISG